MRTKSLSNTPTELHYRSSTANISAIVDVTIIIGSEPILLMALTGGLVTIGVGTGASETGNPTVGKEAKEADG